jgi:hypothetical protein
MANSKIIGAGQDTARRAPKKENERNCKTCFCDHLCNWIQEECDFPNYLKWRPMPHYHYMPCIFMKWGICHHASIIGFFNGTEKEIKLICQALNNITEA